MPVNVKSRRSRRPRRRARKARVGRSLAFRKAPLPNRFPAKLRYSGGATLNPGILTSGVHVFSANGIFDPDITGTGHQPRGFDQFMTMYDHYTVVGAKIHATFSTGAGQLNYVKLCGINLKDSSTPASDPNDYMEGRNVVSRTLAATTTSSGGSVLSLNKKASTGKFLGRSNVMSDPYLKGDASANPTEQLYFHCWAAASNYTGDAQAINLMVVIDYLVIFHEPKQPAQS